MTGRMRRYGPDRRPVLVCSPPTPTCRKDRRTCFRPSTRNRTTNDVPPIARKGAMPERAPSVRSGIRRRTRRRPIWPSTGCRMQICRGLARCVTRPDSGRPEGDDERTSAVSGSMGLVLGRCNAKWGRERPCIEAGRETGIYGRFLDQRPDSRSVLCVCVGLMRRHVRNRIQERAPQTAILPSKLGRPGPGPPRRVPSPDSRLRRVPREVRSRRSPSRSRCSNWPRP